MEFKIFRMRLAHEAGTVYIQLNADNFRASLEFSSRRLLKQNQGTTNTFREFFSHVPSQL